MGDEYWNLRHCSFVTVTLFPFKRQTFPCRKQFCFVFTAELLFVDGICVNVQSTDAHSPLRNKSCAFIAAHREIPDIAGEFKSEHLTGEMSSIQFFWYYC